MHLVVLARWHKSCHTAQSVLFAWKYVSSCGLLHNWFGFGVLRRCCQRFLVTCLLQQVGFLQQFGQQYAGSACQIPCGSSSARAICYLYVVQSSMPCSFWLDVRRMIWTDITAVLDHVMVVEGVSVTGPACVYLVYPAIYTIALPDMCMVFAGMFQTACGL